MTTQRVLVVRDARFYEALIINQNMNVTVHELEKILLPDSDEDVADVEEFMPSSTISSSLPATGRADVNLVADDVNLAVDVDANMNETPLAASTTTPADSLPPAPSFEISSSNIIDTPRTRTSPTRFYAQR